MKYSDLFSKQPGQYVYRELHTPEWLTQYFKLRYSVYIQTALKSFLLQNKAQLDIDTFDLQAKHYGLFKRYGGKEKMVGGNRVIYKNRHPDYPVILGIAGDEETRQQLAMPPPVPYYGLTISKQKLPLGTLIEQLWREGKEVVEASRIFIIPEAMSLKHLKLIELGALASIFYTNINDFAFTLAKPQMASFHNRFGIKPIANLSPEVYKNIGIQILGASKEMIPPQYQAEIMEYLHPNSPMAISFSPNAAKNISMAV